MSYSNQNAEYFEVAYGWDVVGRDGDKIGSVQAIQPHYITVEKGLLFKEDFYIPTSTITDVRDDTVYLSVTKDEVENDDWKREPEMTDRHRDALQYNEQSRADRHSAGAQTTADRMNIPVSEEYLDVRKREVERGNVHVHKNVVEEEQSVDVPLREEQVRVDRHAPAGQSTTANVPDDAFQELDIDIPIRGEEADVSRRARVREEVDISKDVQERNEHVSDTVRREEVHVDRDDSLREERNRRP